MIEKFKETITARPRFAKFTSATCSEIDGTKEYSPIGEIFVHPITVAAFYDHTILIMGNKLRVMETAEEIKERLLV